MNETMATQQLISSATNALIQERDALQSATLAAEQLLTKALAKVDELTQQRDEARRLFAAAEQQMAGGFGHALTLTRQRDELAACLREVLNAMTTGTLVLAPGQLLGNAFQYMTLANRCNAALLRLEVGVRLDDAVQREAKP